MFKLNKGISTTSGILIILLCAVIAGGIFAWQWWGGPEEEVIPPEIRQPEKEKEKAETANLKTYRNEKLGFELKYPSEMTMKEASGEVSDPTGRPTPYYFVIGNIPSQKGHFEMKIFRKKEFDCEDEMTWCGYFCQQIETVVKKDIEVAGYLSKFASFRDISAHPPYIPKIVRICVKSNPPTTFDLLYDEENENKHLAVFNQILSTFHFLE